MLSLNCPPDRLKMAAILLSAILLCSADASADVVTDWNARAVQYSVIAGRPGPSFVLDVAVVQAAVYDAVQAIEGNYQPMCKHSGGIRLDGRRGSHRREGRAGESLPVSGAGDRDRLRKLRVGDRPGRSRV